MGQTKYSRNQKARICAEWALCGDDQAVADKFGVKLMTLKAWKKQAWWKDQVQSMQNATGNKLIAKGHRAMDRALDELQDRLERGDRRVVVKGDQVLEYREPVKARDLSAIVNVLAQRSEKAAELTSQAVQSYQLSDLQDSFREFAKSYRAKRVSDESTISTEYRQLPSSSEPVVDSRDQEHDST
jgi:hypothetical protein